MATPTVDYAFYTGTYKGDSIPQAEFPRLAARAETTLDKFKRIYTVTENTDNEKLAMCAMADALFYFEAIATSGSSSVGSVSSSNPSNGLSDTTKEQSAELLRCAELYLEVYRGVR